MSGGFTRIGATPARNAPPSSRARWTEASASMSMDMQLQMRRNVDEMHASIGDLSAWTSEIGKRDRSLRPGTAGASQAATFVFYP